MSHEEQQTDELDALQAIYPEEFILLGDEEEEQEEDESVETLRPKNVERRKEEGCHKFLIKVRSQTTDEGDEDDVDKNWDVENFEVTIRFCLPKDYPDVGPDIEIYSSDNLEDRDEIEILSLLQDMIPENIGMVMIFTLVSAAFEWINSLKDRKREEYRQEMERRKLEMEEMERKKFDGTRVTVESFIAWKLKFDAEMAEERRRQQERQTSGKDSQEKRLTGKEMFMRDKNLIDSDLAFAETGDLDADVDVDESLFQEDDLLDEDFEDEDD